METWGPKEEYAIVPRNVNSKKKKLVRKARIVETIVK